MSWYLLQVKVGDVSEHEAIVGDDIDHNTKGERGLNNPESEEDKPEVHLTEIKEEPDLEKLSNEEVGRVIAARWTGEDTTVHVPEDSVPKDTTDSDEDQEDVDQEHDYSEEDEYPAYKEDKHLSESVISTLCHLTKGILGYESTQKWLLMFKLNAGCYIKTKYTILCSIGLVLL